jgi:hypothetical protein
LRSLLVDSTRIASNPRPGLVNPYPNRATVFVNFATKEDAEVALAALWLQVELHELTTPDLLIEFGSVGEITFLITTDGSSPADGVLRAWSEVYGGRYLEDKQTRLAKPSVLAEHCCGVAVMEDTPDVGPIAGPDFHSVTSDQSPPVQTDEARHFYSVAAGGAVFLWK